MAADTRGRAAGGDDHAHNEALLADLERAVMESYLREADSSSHYERSSSSMTLSVHDIDWKDEGKVEALNSRGRSTLLLEVLEEWRKLVLLVKKKNDENRGGGQAVCGGPSFMEYAANLWTAFRQLRDNDAKAAPQLYGPLKTLVALLANTVENSGRDDSTECRFVTLLEVALSHGQGWSPSEDVTRFWVRLMQRIPPDVAPVNFRRKAYRVLVSLSWVPSSKGLLEACSFDAGKQTIDPETSPPKVRTFLHRVRGGRPQPRYDCVNQVLDRLKDETDVCVALTSEKEGMGKTTVAALVASHPSILRVFQVLWLSIPSEIISDQPEEQQQRRKDEMTYDVYIKCLDDICDQLSMPLEWPECGKRFEDPALRRLREAAAMEQAKDQMAEALLERDENHLLVLDDVVDSKKVDWFRFNERQSIIVTAPNNSNLEGVDWSVDLGPMSIEEATDLFLVEAGFPVSHVLGMTVEVRKLVRQCECHPLTVRTVARWFKLKEVTAGIAKATEELLKEMATAVPLDHQTDNHNHESRGSLTMNGEGDGSESSEKESSLLFDILSLMIGPARIDGRPTTILFVLCLASLAVVFPHRTPLDSIILLWEQLLKIEPHAIDEMSHRDDPTPAQIRRQAWVIAEGLQFMGLISVTEVDDNPWVEVHHKLYREFAMFMAREMDLGETYEETARQWNRAFVTAYFTQRIEGHVDHIDDNSWEYAIDNLPSHVFRSRMFPMAETILGEEKFFRSRIEAMGWDRALDVHINDCVHLQRALEADHQQNNNNNNSISSNINSSHHSMQSISPVFDKAAAIVATQAKGALVTSEESFINEVSRALFKIAVALAENGYYKESVSQFDSAQNLLPQSQELRASILYGAAWVLLATNKTEKSLKKIKASRKVMEEYVPDHVLYKEAFILQGECLVGECAYKDAVEFFDEGLTKLKRDAINNKIELGTALYKKGRLHHTMGDVEKAVETFKECLNWKVDIGENSRDLMLVHSALGDISMERQNVPEARERYESALQVLESLEYNQEHVDYSLLAGKQKFLRSEFSDSLESLERARRAINSSPKLFMDQSAYDLRCIARCYQARGDLAKAVSVLQQSLALTSDRSYSLERSFGLHELANCLIDQDEINDGLVCLEQSLEIRILKLGECVQVLETLSAIGNVHMSLGAHEESLAVFDKVLELTKRIVPDDVERIAGVLYSIGEVYDAKNDYSEAIAKFDQCMTVLKRDRSSDHPHIAKALQRLGDVSAAQKDFDKAYDFYCEALRIRRMNYDKRQLAETLHSIGVLTRKRKNLDAAQEPLLDALEIRRNLDNGRETGQTLLEIGNVFRLQSKPDDAISVFEKSLDILDEKDDVRASVYLAMGHTKLCLKRDSEALYCYERAREVRLAAYGKDNMKTGNVHRSLGLMKYLTNRGDDALVHLNEFIRVIELNDEEEENEEEGDDIDYVLSVTLMFDIHQANGRKEQAKNLIDVAREVCDESEEVREGLPVLVDMVKRRCALAEESSKATGLFSRLKLSEEAETQLNISEEEEAVLRNIAFIDD